MDVHHHTGFTLLELLVVLTIIGVLAATAIPQYNEYRRRGFDVRAEVDLRNVAIAEEAYFLDNEEYLSCTNDTCSELPGIGRISNGVEITITGDAERFSGASSHPKGTGRVYRWDSDAGGVIE